MIDASRQKPCSSSRFDRRQSLTRVLIKSGLGLVVVIMTIMNCRDYALAQDRQSPAVATAATNDTANGTADASTSDPKVLIPTDFKSVMQIMGVWMVPYVIASVILVWFTLERMVVLRRGRVIPKHFATQFIENLKQGKLDQATAIALCEQHRSPLAELFLPGLRKWGRPGIEVEQAVIDGGERQVSKLRKHVRALNTISVIMPMVGLFGTVVGMVQSFNELALAASTGNNALLAAGIAVALLTTAFGLAIAIPALTIYVFLTSKVESLVNDMDELATEVAYLVSAEGLQFQKTSPTPQTVRPKTAPTRPAAAPVEASR